MQKKQPRLNFNFFYTEVKSLRNSEASILGDNQKKDSLMT